MSYTSKQPDLPTVFLDRNFGKKIVPDILAAFQGIRIEIHDDNFRQDLKDPELLAEIGKRKWLFLTNDKRIRYNPLAIQVIKQSRVKVYILAVRGDLLGEETGEILLNSMARILKFNTKHSGPFIAKIDRSGKVEMTNPF